MRFDVLMLEIHGSPLTAQQTLGVRQAALAYLRCGGKGLSKFKVEDLGVEGFIERTGTKEDGPLQGAVFSVDLGTEGGILRKIEFVIPWETMDVKIEDDSLLMFGRLIFPKEWAKKSGKLKRSPKPPGSKLLH